MKTKGFDSTFISEGSATRICLILRAYSYKFKDKKETYNKLYPLLCPKSKKFVDEEMQRFKLTGKFKFIY